MGDSGAVPETAPPSTKYQIMEFLVPDTTKYQIMEFLVPDTIYAKVH
jgi:hypothetical protein